MGVEITTVVVDESLMDDSSRLVAGSDVINEGKSLSLSDFKLFVDVVHDEGLKALLYADQKAGWMLFGETNHLEYLQSCPVSEIACLSTADIEYCTPITDGAWNSLPDHVTDQVASECDVVLRFGFGLLKGRILSAPEYGVLSVHGSDIREYRGMGPRITFLNDDEYAKVTLQQLTEDIDGGLIVEVAERELPENPSLDEVYGAVYELQSRIFAIGIQRLLNCEEPTKAYQLGEYYSHSRLEQDPLFTGKIIGKNLIRRIFS